MKKYIERDAVVSTAYGYCHTIDGRCCGPDDVVELYEELKVIPSADVVEVKHGHWIWTGSCQICSICDEEQYGVDTGRYYCPNCGAKMDGKKSE